MQSMIEDNNGQKSKNNFIDYTLKILAYVLFLILSPFIYLGILWLGFKMLVLNKSIDIKPMLEFAAKKLRTNNNDEIDINELNELNEDDLVMVDVEDITNKEF
jgi:hypothetical protein